MFKPAYKCQIYLTLILTLLAIEWHLFQIYSVPNDQFCILPTFLRIESSKDPEGASRAWQAINDIA